MFSGFIRRPPTRALAPRPPNSCARLAPVTAAPAAVPTRDATLVPALLAATVTAVPVPATTPGFLMTFLTAPMTLPAPLASTPPTSFPAPRAMDRMPGSPLSSAACICRLMVFLPGGAEGRTHAGGNRAPVAPWLRLGGRFV